MPEHRHIEDDRAQEIGELIKKGKTDIMAPCEICRGKIEKALDSCNGEETPSAVDIGVLKFQMCATAEFVKNHKEKRGSAKSDPSSDFVREALARLSHMRQI